MIRFAKTFIFSALSSFIGGVGALLLGYKISAIRADIDPAIVFLFVCLISCGFGVYKILTDRSWSFLLGLIFGLLISLIATSLLLWGA